MAGWPTLENYTDVMIDLETTGTSRDHSAVIQIAAVMFNLHDFSIHPVFFNECLTIPGNRYWEESTRQWWSKMPDLLKGIYSKMREPRVVMEEFYWWLGGTGRNMRSWGKPSAFDASFIESYFREYGPAQPLHFRGYRDLRTFIHGVTYPYEFDENSVPFEGQAHDAIFDCLHQIKLLRAAVNFQGSAPCLEQMTQETGTGTSLILEG
jgi:hypothetical protein